MNYAEKTNSTTETLVDSVCSDIWEARCGKWVGRRRSPYALLYITTFSTLFAAAKMMQWRGNTDWFPLLSGLFCWELNESMRLTFELDVPHPETVYSLQYNSQSSLGFIGKVENNFIKVFSFGIFYSWSIFFVFFIMFFL